MRNMIDFIKTNKKIIAGIAGVVAAVGIGSILFFSMNGENSGQEATKTDAVANVVEKESREENTTVLLAEKETEPETMEVPTEVETTTEATTEAPTEERTTEAPTQKPTEPPTQKPTQAPTEAPTQKPTEAPTQAPTQKPTEAPTQAPTQKPTEAPTQKPTQAPTQKPTETPTQASGHIPVSELDLSGFPHTDAEFILNDGETLQLYKWCTYNGVQGFFGMSEAEFEMAETDANGRYYGDIIAERHGVLWSTETQFFTEYVSVGANVKFFGFFENEADVAGKNNNYFGEYIRLRTSRTEPISIGITGVFTPDI